MEFLYDSYEIPARVWVSCAIFLLFIQVVSDFVYNFLDDFTACWNFIEIAVSFAFKFVLA